jgi:predicted enzyme involved in methoxymalonyl-ACP biosynthesis
VKTKQVIVEEILDCEIQIKELKLKHNNLDQISILSEEGLTSRALRARINKCKGKIEALKWVIS